MHKSIKWKPEFSIGIHTIDNQHKMLFDLISNLSNTSKITREQKKINITILDVICNYTFNHFETEEDYFKDHPDSIQHCNEHYKLIKQLNKITIDFHNGRKDESELAQFLNNWLIDHILKTDQLFLKQTQEEQHGLMDDTVTLDEYGLGQTERRHYQRIQQNVVVSEKITAHCFNATTMKNHKATIINMSAGGLLLKVKSQQSINDLLIINCRVGRNFKMKEKVKVKSVNNQLHGVEFISPSQKTIDFFMELYGAVHLSLGKS